MATVRTCESIVMDDVFYEHVMIVGTTRDDAHEAFLTWVRGLRQPQVELTIEQGELAADPDVYVMDVTVRTFTWATEPVGDEHA